MNLIQWLDSFYGISRQPEQTPAAPTVTDVTAKAVDTARSATAAVQHATPPVPPPAKARALFDVSIAYVLKNEGGFSDNIHDHGGATNYGITSATYSKWKGHTVSSAEVRAMPLSDAKAIYRQQYWCSALDQFDQGVATCILDFSVLHGTHGGRSMAQTTANRLGAKLSVDGELGPKSIAAINAIQPRAFTAHYALGVKSYLNGLVAEKPSQAVFKRGWDARAEKLATLS